MFVVSVERRWDGPDETIAEDQVGLEDEQVHAWSMAS